MNSGDCVPTSRGPGRIICHAMIRIDVTNKCEKRYCLTLAVARNREESAENNQTKNYFDLTYALKEKAKENNLITDLSRRGNQ